MKCDELTIYNAKWYEKEEVDEAIEELKQLATLWECNAQNEHNAAIAVRMENLKLKQQLRKICLAMDRAVIL